MCYVMVLILSTEFQTVQQLILGNFSVVKTIVLPGYKIVISHVISYVMALTLSTELRIAAASREFLCYKKKGVDFNTTMWIIYICILNYLSWTNISYLFFLSLDMFSY